MKSIPKLLTLGALSVLSFHSAASVELSGFASFIAGKTLDDGETAYGYDDHTSFSQESRIALQAKADMGEGLSATVQMIGRGRDEYDPAFEWAYLSYGKIPNNTFNVGRIRIPFYRESEYLETGFVYHWIRPPQNLYTSLFNSWDGVGWVNKHTLGSADGQFQVQYGRLVNDALDAGGGSTIDIEFQGFATEYVVNLDSWQARIGYMVTDIMVESQLNTFFDAAIDSIETNLSTTVPQQYQSNFLLDGDRLDYLSASLRYDNFDYFVGAEYAKAEYDDLSINPDLESWYLTGGCRLNGWTFHLTYGETDNTKREYSELVQGISLSPALDGALGATTNGFTSSGALAGEDSAFYTYGVNYQFHSAAILKVDYTTYDNDTVNGKPDADIVSVGVDIVF